MSVPVEVSLYESADIPEDELHITTTYEDVVVVCVIKAPLPTDNDTIDNAIDAMITTLRGIQDSRP